MMRFIRNNWMPLTLIVLFILSETLHLFFSNMVFKVKTDGSIMSYKNPVYYLTTQFGLITFIPSVFIFILIPKSKKSTKSLMLGIVILSIKELVDELFYIFKVQSVFWDALTTFNSGFYGEITFIILLVIFTYIGCKAWGT